MLLRHLFLLLWTHKAAAIDEYDPFSVASIDGMSADSWSQNGIYVRRALGDVPGGMRESLQGTVVDIAEEEVQSIALTPGEQGSIYAFSFTTSATDFVSSYYLSANYGEFPNGNVQWMSDEEMQQYFGLRFYINDTSGGYVESFDEGYAADIAYFSNKQQEQEGVLYVQPYFDANSTLFNDTDKFVVEFAISADELVYQWDNGTFVTLVDTDDSSVFLRGKTFNTSVESVEDWKNDTASITLHLFDEEGYGKLYGLTKSWLAVTQAVSVVSLSQIDKIYSQSMGGLQEQFFASGLNSSTVYHAVITNDFDDGQGGIVFSSLELVTQSAGACELIYGLEFCDNVAYSVPRSSVLSDEKNATALAQLYDSYASSMYTNFSYAMQQIACDAELDARYSPIATCEDCLSSYKNWLCGVTIPRCSTTNDTNFKSRDAGEMRTPHLSTLIDPPEPWYEVLPCIDMCYALVRMCPSDFGFTCPDTEDMVVESYAYWDDDWLYATCNNVGNGTTTAVKNSGLSLRPVAFMGVPGSLVGVFVWLLWVL